MEYPSTKEPELTYRGYDIVIVGGGASGLAAGVFAARYGFDTLIFDRGQSAIRRSYCIENSLGFFGIDPETFLDLGRAHARFEGCEVVDDLVVEVPETDDGFRARTQDGTLVDTTYIVAASAYDADYLCGLDDGTFHDEGDHPVECDEATGRTGINGLYVTGWLSGSPHQVLISAGHGARVAKTLTRDHRLTEEGYWEGIADYWDWCVERGTYGGDQWHAHVDEWIEGTLPNDHDFDEERIGRVRREIKQERLDFERTDEERRRRLDRGRELLRRKIDESAREE